MDNKELVEVVDKAIEYCDKLEKAISNGAELFRSDKIAAGSKLLLEILDAIQWVIDVAAGTKDLQTSKVDIEDVNEKLKLAIEAFENSDYNLLGDVLEYEVLEGTSNIKTSLQTVKKNK